MAGSSTAPYNNYLYGLEQQAEEESLGLNGNGINTDEKTGKGGKISGTSVATKKKPAGKTPGGTGAGHNIKKM